MRCDVMGESMIQKGRVSERESGWSLGSGRVGLMGWGWGWGWARD